MNLEATEAQCLQTLKEEWKGGETWDTRKYGAKEHYLLPKCYATTLWDITRVGMSVRPQRALNESALSLLTTVPSTHNLEEERHNLAHSFRGLSPWSDSKEENDDEGTVKHGMWEHSTHLRGHWCSQVDVLLAGKPWLGELGHLECDWESLPLGSPVLYLPHTENWVTLLHRILPHDAPALEPDDHRLKLLKPRAK